MRLLRWLRPVLTRGTLYLLRTYGVRWTVRHLRLGWRMGWATREESIRMFADDTCARLIG